MAPELEALNALRDRVQKVADECKLDVQVFTVIVDEKPALQMVFAVRPDAVKSAAALEQEKFDAQFADIFDSAELADIFDDGEKPDKPEEDDNSEDIMRDLGNWMEGYKDD